jgi:hypothetical protein
MSGHGITMPSMDRDPNVIAARLVRKATGQDTKLPEDDDRHEHAVESGRKAGKVGGKARAKRMTAEERSESARRAAQARWSKDS